MVFNAANSTQMWQVCTPVKGLLYMILSGSLLAPCVSFPHQLPLDLSILPCLLREGWIPLSEQYPHASLGIFKALTSSWWWWQSCTHRLKTGPQFGTSQFSFEASDCKGLLAVKPVKSRHYMESEIPETISLYPQLLLHRSLLFCSSFNEILCLIKLLRSRVWGSGDHDVDGKLQASWPSS